MILKISSVIRLPGTGVERGWEHFLQHFFFTLPSHFSARFLKSNKGEFKNDVEFVWSWILTKALKVFEFQTEFLSPKFPFNRKAKFVYDSYRFVTKFYWNSIWLFMNSRSVPNINFILPSDNSTRLNKLLYGFWLWNAVAEIKYGNQLIVVVVQRMKSKLFNHVRKCECVPGSRTCSRAQKIKFDFHNSKHKSWQNINQHRTRSWILNFPFEVVEQLWDSFPFLCTLVKRFL